MEGVMIFLRDWLESSVEGVHTVYAPQWTIISREHSKSGEAIYVGYDEDDIQRIGIPASNVIGQFYCDNPPMERPGLLIITSEKARQSGATPPTPHALGKAK